MNPAETVSTVSADAGTALYRRAEQILLPGLAMGIAGDYLLREGPFGPGLFLWLLLLSAFALWLVRDAGRARQRTIMAWSAAALCAALVTVLRDLEPLIPAMLLVILLCAVLTALETSGIALHAARIRDYLVTGFSLPLQMLTFTPRLLKQADLSAVTRNQRVPGVVRGVLLAVPVLLVFGLLFAAADAGFSLYLSALNDFISPSTLQHLLLVLVFAWLATSLLGVACRRPSATTTDQVATPPIAIGTTETHVVLALLSTLFVAFVLLQLGYLFGGSEVIESTSGLTVAEHARRGFFELVVIAALTLALLFGFSLTDCDRGVLRRYGLVLIVCVMIILASALQRLFLYTDAFGMTIDRFSALAAILWLVFNLVAFALTVLRGDIRGFASGVAISGISCLLLLGIANPAGTVTRINLERSLDGNSALDVDYLLQLGADALPSLIEHYDELDATAQCTVATFVAANYPHVINGVAPAEEEDWRRANLSRLLARNAVLESPAQLKTLAASPAC